MKQLLITIGLCLFIILVRAQKIYPYTITDRQVDSLHAVLAHTTNDSVKMELNSIFAFYYSENNMDSGIFFFNRQLEFATKLDIPLWRAQALSFLCYLYAKTGSYPKSLKAHYTLLQIANDNSSDRNKYAPKFLTGLPAWFTSRECIQGNASLTSGLLHDWTGDHEKGAADYKECIRIAKRIGDKESLPLFYIDLGDNCRIRDKLDSALMLTEKAIALSREAHWQYYMGGMYESLAEVYRSKGNDSAALRIFRLAAAFNHQQHNLLLEGTEDGFIAMIFLEKRQPDSAIFYFRKAQTLLDSKVESASLKAFVYRRLSDAFQMKGNKDSAYSCLLLSKKINDSLSDVTQEQTVQYQAMLFEEQNRQREVENERAQQQARLITYATLAGLAIASFILFLLYRNNRQKQKTNRALTAVRDLQDQRISLLDEAVKQRTDQLTNMRQIIASDFHDETGNMLSVITQQASLLKLQVGDNNTVLPIADSIIQNSNDLYARSRDFLWNLNHNSDDPEELFNYLTAYGQLFYNQFDIDFSPVMKGEVQPLQQLNTFAAVNLIFIFKEVMTNVVKHAGASEVVFEMEYRDSKVVYALQDNGRWKPKNDTQPHYGLTNMERRCEKNNFGFLLSQQEGGTRVEITVPVAVNLV